MNSTPQKNPWNEDLQLPNKTGCTNHDILKRICHYLPTQQDCFQASFVDHSWRYAATNVLWESPIFRTPSSFRYFLSFIDREKRFSHNVKHLTLCLPGDPSPTLFRPINESEQTLHVYKDNALSRTGIVLHLANVCQQLQSLTVYGWNLAQTDYDQLYAYLPRLKNLKVMGCHEQLTQSNTFQLNTYLPTLSKLVLDGRFPINLNFAQAIATKAQYLTTLQLSLASMTPSSLIALCDQDAPLDLIDLTLTHGTHITDAFIDNILRRFNHLHKFCLQGSQHITTEVIKSGIKHCQQLQHLEIRQCRLSPPKETNGGCWELGALDHDLRTLVVENIWFDDGTLDNVAFYCPYLTYLGLSHTGVDLTDIGIECLGKAALIHLKQLYLIDCPAVTSKALIYLPFASLFLLHLESIGKVEPVDLFHICSQAMEHALVAGLRRSNLRCLRVVGHKSIATSIIGSLASELDGLNDSTSLAESSNYQVTLDQQAIHDLSYSDIFTLVSHSIILTSRQIVELSRKLRMPLKKLIGILEGLKVEKSVNGLSLTNDDQVHLSRSPPMKLSADAKNGLDTGLQQKRSIPTTLLSQQIPASPHPLPQQKDTPIPDLSQHPTSFTQSSSSSSTLYIISSDTITPNPSPSHSSSPVDALYQTTTANGHADDASRVALGGWGGSDVIPAWNQGNPRNTNKKSVNTSSVVQRTDMNQWGPPKKILSWRAVEPFASEYMEEQERKSTLWNTPDDAALETSNSYNTSANNSSNKNQKARTSTTRFSTNPVSAEKETPEMINNDHNVSSRLHSIDSDDSIDFSDDDGITLKIDNSFFYPQTTQTIRPDTTCTAPRNLNKSMKKAVRPSKSSMSLPKNTSDYKGKSKVTKAKYNTPRSSSAKPEPFTNNVHTPLKSNENVMRWQQFAGTTETSKVNKQHVKISPVATPAEDETDDTGLLIDISDSNTVINHIPWATTPNGWKEWLMDIKPDDNSSTPINCSNDINTSISNPNDTETENLTCGDDTNQNITDLNNDPTKPGNIIGYSSLLLSDTKDAENMGAGYELSSPLDTNSPLSFTDLIPSTNCTSPPPPKKIGVDSSSSLDYANTDNDNVGNLATTSTTHHEAAFEVRLSIKLHNGTKVLKLSKAEDHEAVHAFCVEHDALEKEQAIFKLSTEKYLKKRTDNIFRTVKKTKKTK